MNRLVPYSTLIASLVLFSPTTTRAQVHVLTYHNNNNSRTGDNLSETNLTVPGAFVTESSVQGVSPDSFVTVTITDTSVLADPNAPTRFYRLAVHR